MPTARLVTYNIQYGKGQDGEVNLARIADEVRGADVIALQEVDRFWPYTGMVDQVAELTRHLPDYYWVYGAGVDIHVEGSTPGEQKRRNFGNLLLCKTPILRSRHHLLPKLGSTDALSIQRSAVEATVDLNGRRLRLYSVHLCHLSARTRLPQVQKILDIHRNAVREGAALCGDVAGKDFETGVYDQRVPVEAIIMGDCNFQPGSEEYHEIVGPVSDYGGLVASADGFVDAWTAAGNDRGSPDRGQGLTADVAGNPATLDYCFVSTTLRSRIQRCTVDQAARGSDHFPVWTEIDL